MYIPRGRLLDLLIRIATPLLIYQKVTNLKVSVVLVDDASNLPDLGQQLEDYVAINFPKIIKIVRLRKRCGLIKAKVEGAKKATGQVLVFLDSHIEVNINWVSFWTRGLTFLNVF